MIFKILKELLKTIIIGQKQKNVNYQTSLYEHLIFFSFSAVCAFFITSETYYKLQSL